MERLTERLENGVIKVKYASQHETAIHRLVTIEDILGDEYDLDRLRELAQADREGRCVVLPCKVGETVYWAVRGRVRKAGFDLSASKYFGKYVFTTCEAAEQALKEVEKDG